MLTDFATYAGWNSFIPHISGPAKTGSQLDVQMQPPGGFGMRLHPAVLAANPGQELGWLGHTGMPRPFDGDHRFRIESLGAGRVRFVQEERFTGVLTPLVLLFID